MEHKVEIQFKLQRYTELAIARRERHDKNFAERFDSDLTDHMIILPLKAKISKFSWITESINHEYLHLIITELESATTSKLLDNLGYNLATGYTEEGDC